MRSFCASNLPIGLHIVELLLLVSTPLFVLLRPVAPFSLVLVLPIVPVAPISILLLYLLRHFLHLVYNEAVVNWAIICALQAIFESPQTSRCICIANCMALCSFFCASPTCTNRTCDTCCVVFSCSTYIRCACNSALSFAFLVSSAAA